MSYRKQTINNALDIGPMSYIRHISFSYDNSFERNLLCVLGLELGLVGTVVVRVTKGFGL